MPLGSAIGCARHSTLAARRGRAILVLLLLALATTGAWADSRSASTSVQRRIAQAWGAENAAGITATMRPGGTVQLDLLLLDRGGSFQRSQAERTLRAYFRKIARIRLKDVTPRNQRASGQYRVSTYEYAYEPQGRDAVTALLVITLRSRGNDRWYIEAVKERRKRPTRRR